MDCLLVWRVEGGSFDHMRAIMNAQIGGMGLQLGAGSVVVVSLMTHLFRLGESGYWQELCDFTDWCKHEFKLTVLPTMTPYPRGLPWRFISAARRFYARLQWKNFGNSTVRNNPLFSLWRPLMTVTLTLTDICEVKYFTTEPLMIKNNKDIKDPYYVGCDGQFLMGAGEAADWANGMPAVLEKAYIDALVSGVKDVQTNPDLVTPTKDSIVAGLNKNVAFREHQGRKIFLLGASNMSNLKRHILHLARPAKVEIIPLCERGDFLTFFNDNPRLLDALLDGGTNDLLFFNPTGNRVVKWDVKDKMGKNFHFSHPQLLTDQQFIELMAEVNLAVSAIHKVFAGRCILMGPYPRMLRDCCLDSSHWLRDDDDKQVDMLQYTDIITDHMYRAADLPTNFAFLGYKEIFKTEKFNVSFLVDNVHLDPVAQQVVAGHMMSWLDRNNDPVAGKSAETNLGPLSEALFDVGINNHKVNMQEEGGSGTEDDNSVFDDSAKRFLDQQEQKKQAEAAAAAAAAATAANGSNNSVAMEQDSQNPA